MRSSGKSLAENRSSVTFIRQHFAVYYYDMPGAKYEQLKGNKRQACILLYLHRSLLFSFLRGLNY